MQNLWLVVTTSSCKTIFLMCSNCLLSLLDHQRIIWNGILGLNVKLNPQFVAIVATGAPTWWWVEGPLSMSVAVCATSAQTECHLLTCFSIMVLSIMAYSLKKVVLSAIGSTHKHFTGVGALHWNEVVLGRCCSFYDDIHAVGQVHPLYK
jgi:hypothetical protein